MGISVPEDHAVIKTLSTIAIIITTILIVSIAFAENNSEVSQHGGITSESYSDAPDIKDKTTVKTLQKKPLNDVEKIQEQIKTLEEKINKLSEENDIRRRLETTAEEKSSSDESILSSAGRDYTLMKPGLLGFEYNFSYSGDAYDSVTTSDSVISVNHNAYHTITNAFYIEFPVKDNLTVSSNIPFVYKYGSTTNTSTTKGNSDFGDVSFGCQFQPVKSGGSFPSFILSSNLSCPTGRSPYKIDSAHEMSTGNGG
jgi:hypothetical protein